MSRKNLKNLLAGGVALVLCGGAWAGEYPPRPAPKPTTPRPTVAPRPATPAPAPSATATSHGSPSTSTATSHGSPSSATAEGHGGAGGRSSVQNKEDNTVVVAPGLALAGSADCVESFSISVLFAGVARSYRCPLRDMEDALAAYLAHGKNTDPVVQDMVRRMRAHAFGSELPPETPRDVGGEMN